MKQLKGLKKQAGFLGSLVGSLAPTLLGGLLGGGDGGTSTATQQTSALPFQSSSGLFDVGFQDGTLTAGISDPRLQAIQQQGLFGAQDFLSRAMGDPNAQLAGQLGGQFMQQAGITDPMQIAQQQFGLLNPILQEQQMQQQLGLEGRQFAQGRLGSTGGARDFGQLMRSQQDAERQLLFESLGQGLQTQQQQAGLGAMFSQLDPSLRGAFQNLGTGMLNIPMQLQQAMMNQASVAGGLSGATTTGTQTPAGLSPMQTIGAGLMNQGVQGLTSLAGGLFK